VATTIPRLLLQRIARDPGGHAFRYKEDGAWTSQTWSECLDELSQLTVLLQGLGVGPATPVVVLAETCREWAALDLALLALGAITVGVYPTLTADQVAWQVRHCRAPVVLARQPHRVAELEARREDLPDLVHAVSFDDLLAMERPVPDAAAFRARCEEVSPDQVAAVVYTSGTTGDPKGVVLTHRNLTTVCEASRELIPAQPGDRSLVFLPMAHVLQRFALYRGLYEEIEGTFAESLELLPEAIAEGRPTVLATVPRMLEKIKTRAEDTAAGKGPRAERVFSWAFRVGVARSHLLERQQPVPWTLSLQWHLADRLVFSRIKERLGGALHTLVSGGAALDPEVARWFHAMGIAVLEGWGLSETSAPATTNAPDAYRFGTVGRALPGVELRLAPDGEVLVRGPGVFQGYLHDPEATAAALRDGWFHTGDIGTLDDDGFLSIVDRKKELIVTAGGKNIAPVPIEHRLERSPYVDKAVVIGSDRPYLVALLSPDLESVATWAARAGVDPSLASPEVQALFQRAVDAANADLARFQRVKRHAVLDHSLTIEDGDLTPTLKLKRRAVLASEADRIAALYAQPSEDR